MILAAAVVLIQAWVTDPWTPDRRVTHDDSVITEPTEDADVTVSLQGARDDQILAGFGASVTDAAAEALSSLSAPDRHRLLEELFGSDTGLGLSLLRQPIGTTDFSRTVESEDDVPPGSTDPGLDHFTVARDKRQILPILNEIAAIQPRLSLIVSPWSPPAWMKTGQSMIGRQGGALDSRWNDAYARYLVRFVQAYQAANFHVEAITVQNEPAYLPPQYPGMLWGATDEARFIGQVGPILSRDCPGVKILAWDHNYDHADQASALLDSPEAVWMAGTAWHDYAGDAASVDAIRRAHPEKEVWMTEGGLGSWIAGGSFRGVFHQGVVQGVEALNHGARSYVLWNLALNEHNGPTLFPNSSNEGLVTIDSAQTVSRNASYWVLAQFSKFLPPGSVRQTAVVTGQGVAVTVFRTPRGLVAVLANRYSSNQTVLISQGPSSFAVTVPGDGAVTVVWPPTS